MPDVLRMPSSVWDAQPQKKRRVTMDDIERDFLKLSLSGNSWENVKLDTLLQTLTLSPSPVRPAFPSLLGRSGPSAPREVDCMGNLRESCGKENRCAPMIEVVSVTEDYAADSGAQSSCTAIVPFHKPARQRRWRRIPRITQQEVAARQQIPRCFSAGSPAKFAVDAEGTAFVIHDSVTSELSRARETFKRACAEDERNVTSTAIVIYQKPRKHDLVEDFMTLRL